MLPQNDLPLRVIGATAHFDFLGPQDEPWVGFLLAEMHRFEGKRRRQLAERLAEPMPFEAPHFKRRAASRVLMRLWKPERLRGPRPALLREALFVAAAGNSPPDAVVGEVATRFGMDQQALRTALFSDLPGERIVQAPAERPCPRDVVLRTNLAIAQAALTRAASVDLSIVGATRPIVRLAKWRGLLCVVRQNSDDPCPVLEISGPFSLFRHTLIYGRALAELLPHLAWCQRFALHARCALRGRLCDITLDNTAPLFPAQPPRPFDSKLEQRFAHDISKLALDWDVVREPEPLPADGTLIFPDFLLRHRIHPERQAFVEIVGFWTPEYLAKKFHRLKASGINNLIVCVDQDRLCADAPPPAGLPLVPFRQRIDAAAVLREIERLLAIRPPA